LLYTPSKSSSTSRCLRLPREGICNVYLLELAVPAAAAVVVGVYLGSDFFFFSSGGTIGRFCADEVARASPLTS